MNKPASTSLKGFLFLLIYIFSNLPSVISHNHTSEKISYARASDCEKSIYFAYGPKVCHHKTHITNPQEKCNLCDNHTVSPHNIQFFEALLTKRKSFSSVQIVSQQYSFQDFASHTTRGPPIL